MKRFRQRNFKYDGRSENVLREEKCDRIGSNSAILLLRASVYYRRILIESEKSENNDLAI